MDERLIKEVGGGLYSVVFYALFFWRVFKKNPGNRVVECGVITLAVFFAMIPLSKLQDPPDWVFAPWLILVILLCFSTLFFVVQRAYRAIRHRKDA
jgi:hypothetical protein